MAAGSCRTSWRCCCARGWGSRGCELRVLGFFGWVFWWVFGFLGGFSFQRTKKRIVLKSLTLNPEEVSLVFVLLVRGCRFPLVQLEMLLSKRLEEQGL